MKEVVAKFLAKFIDVFQRLGLFIEMLIPLVSVWLSYNASTNTRLFEAPQPFWTYTKAFFLILALWWLVLKALTLLIRAAQYVSSGQTDSADLVLNANKDAPEIRKMREQGRSDNDIRAQLAEEIRESKRFNRWFSFFFLGTLYLIGLVVVAIVT